MPRTAPAKAGATRAAGTGTAAAQTLTIRIDTREQDPFTFASVTMPILPLKLIRGTLPTGDYADDGRHCLPPAEQAVVERKSLADLYGSLGHGRERFEREFVRLAEYGYAALVIESDWSQIMRPNDYLRHLTRLKPKTVVNTLLAWGERYGVHVWPCPGRRFAEQLTHRIIERWSRDHMQQEQPNA